MPVSPRALTAASAIVLALATPATARAQSMSDILAAINGGSRDFAIPAPEGALDYTSPLVPTAGLKFTGFLRIDGPTSGRWTILVTDASRSAGSEPVLDRTVRAGQALGFAYRTGPTAQLKVKARWSKGESTTARVHIEWQTCATC
jgi:hypothetical protein